MYAPTRATLLACVHCGLCLTSCPTYRVDRNEADSPRGRIYLMRAVQEGRLGLTADVVEHIDGCVGCRACETTCPAGVQFGALLEATRAEITTTVRRPFLPRLVSAFIFRAVLPRPWMLRLVALATRFYQASGVRWLVVRSGLRARLPLSLRIAEELLPPTARARTRRAITGPERDATSRGPIGFLRTCAMSIALPNVDRATRVVLARNGYEIVEPEGQSCCGALHVHSGRREEARALARREIALFEAAGVDLIVTNSAGCGSALKDYGHLLAADPEWHERAVRFASRVRDITELFATTPIAPPGGSVPDAIAYQDACHLAHAQRIRQPPRAMLAALPGATIVDLPQSDFCCGSGGIYNLARPQMGEQLLAEKIAAIRRSGATVLAVANPGCLLHIGRGLRNAGLPIRVAHPVELLAEAYEGSES